MGGRHTNADCHSASFAALMWQGARIENLSEPFGYRESLGRACVWQNSRKLLTTISRNRVSGTYAQRPQTVGDGLEAVVSSRMTITVVAGFETVHIARCPIGGRRSVTKVDIRLWGKPPFVVAGNGAEFGALPTERRDQFMAAVDIEAFEDRQRRIRRLKTIAQVMDTAFAIPGTGIRFGADAILGLIPRSW